MPEDLMTATLSPDDRIHTLHATHGPSVLRLLIKMTHGDRMTAEDLLQETMLRAWRHVDTLPEQEPGQRRWLYAVARRIFIDTVRSKRVRPAETPVVDLEWITRSEDTTDAALAGESMVSAFHQLSAAHPKVLSDLHFHGRSVDEVARDLGVPAGTVKSRAHYAMRALRSGMEPVG
jgi:RNA polymerase sigma-70 factor, ECF subfamily